MRSCLVLCQTLRTGRRRRRSVATPGCVRVMAPSVAVMPADESPEQRETDVQKREARAARRAHREQARLLLAEETGALVVEMPVPTRCVSVTNPRSDRPRDQSRRSTERQPRFAA